MTINISVAGDKLPVFCQYETETNPQPAYLEFDPCEDEISLDASYNAEIGNAVPENVCHGRVIRIEIPPCTSRNAILALANDEWLEGRLQAAKDAYKEIWDGNQYIGSWGEDSYEFWEEIESRLADSLEQVEVGTAGEWFGSCIDRNAIINAGGIKALADEYESDADCEGVVITDDMADAIASWAQEDVQHYIRSESEPNEDVLTLAKILNEHDAETYGYLLADYAEEFGEEADDGYEP